MGLLKASSFLGCFPVPQGWCIALRCSGYERETGCLWSLLTLHNHKYFCLTSRIPLPSGETAACFSFSSGCESRPFITGTPFPWMHFSWFKRLWIFKRETWDFLVKASCILCGQRSFLCTFYIIQALSMRDFFSQYFTYDSALSSANHTHEKIKVIAYL